ncbi:hypothetical protein MPSEU_001085800 [Mayamaea pseudoterrestris]|nr:hypothetical protein MPSEU_001085800 [Mayamaea pseudoterrestris]
MHVELRQRWFAVSFSLFLSHQSITLSTGFAPPTAEKTILKFRGGAMSMSTTDARLKELGIELPPAPKPAANYVPCQRDGTLLYLSGHLPLRDDGSLFTGVVGAASCETDRAADVERGYQAARQCGLNLIATLKQELDGDLDRVKQIVKLFGIVQSASDFHEQHKVMNGCSDVMVQVFGKERGLHARSAIGTNALPLDITVEVEAIVRVKD